MDAIEYTLNTNLKDIYNRIERGQLDMSWEAAPPAVMRRYAQSDELAERLHRNRSDATQYISMNLTQPPFDDVHLRKAVNWILDKEGLRRAFGGPLTGEIAGHIVPDAMFDRALEDYRPYGTPEDAGDLEKAQAEMRLSKYDTDKDGRCDASACRDVLHLTATFAPFPDLAPILEASLAKIGIRLDTRELESYFVVTGNVSKNVPIGSAYGWAKDYADPSTFMVLFDSRTIAPQGNYNTSLVGITPERADEVGAKGTVEGIPSVDSDIDRCATLAGDERMTCWQELDKKLMEEIVPWVPWLYPAHLAVVSERVTRYVYDQYAGLPSLARIAVETSQ